MKRIVSILALIIMVIVASRTIYEEYTYIKFVGVYVFLQSV